MELQSYRYNHTVNKGLQQPVTQDRNGTAQRWSVCNKGITQFFTCHPHTNHTFLSVLPSCRTSLFCWYSLRQPKKGWPGWVDLGGWSHTEINVTHRDWTRILTSTNLLLLLLSFWSRRIKLNIYTNRAQGRLTSLIEANALTLRQTTTSYWLIVIEPHDLR